MQGPRINRLARVLGTRLPYVFLYAWCAGALEAQRAVAAIPEPPRPLQVYPFADLSFGVVLPGVPTVISVRNSARAGKFEISGPIGAAVRVELVLPSALQTTHGASMALTFNAGDGLALASAPSSGSLFDPNLPYITTLNDRGLLQVRLGGTVSPGLPQPGGNYTATITLVVFDLGT